ncbi:MAG: DUF11 domain-containing protein [Chloroflexi bacterium]|nr:DUF11 domain-containing protein [Chloroflexota bacterium]
MNSFRLRRQSEPQAGQAFILVLILLAIGALLIVPALNLSGTSLKSSQIVTRQAKELYAADAAQELVMWKLLYNNYASSLTVDQPSSFSVDVCGIPVNVTVIMRAVATWRGVTLIANTPIKPSKTVSLPVSGTYTYTINLEQISDDTSQGLDAVYDILPGYTSGSGSFGLPYYDYQPGTSELSEDGGSSWQQISDPAVVKYGSNIRLQWPATYDYSTGTGGFTSPTSNFTGGQVKKIQFKVKPSSLGPNKTYYNWVVLKPWDTLAGPIAPVVTGSGDNPSDGLLSVTKGTNTPFILPGQLTNVTYTVTITNLQGSTNQIQQITDYLPPGFSYIGPTSGLPTGKYTFVRDPDSIVNGVLRETLDWTFSPAWAIGANPPDNVLTFTFVASTSEYVSGSYYNEIVVIPNQKAGTAFSSIGISDEDFSTGYSWNSAPVIVPAYDSSATAGSTTTVTNDANLGLTTDSVVFFSYQVR